MTRQDVLRIFGSYAKAGRALGMSRQAVWQWDDPIPTMYADRIIGACLRQGIPIPADILLKKSA
jgi:hypothetical protein